MAVFYEIYRRNTRKRPSEKEKAYTLYRKSINTLVPVPVDIVVRDDVPFRKLFSAFEILEAHHTGKKLSEFTRRKS